MNKATVGKTMFTVSILLLTIFAGVQAFGFMGRGHHMGGGYHKGGDYGSHMGYGNQTGSGPPNPLFTIIPSLLKGRLTAGLFLSGKNLSVTATQLSAADYDGKPVDYSPPLWILFCSSL